MPDNIKQEKKNSTWLRPWNLEKFDDLYNRDERFFSILLKGTISYLNNNDRKEAKVLLEQLLVQYPDNELFKTMLNEINEIKGLFY